jgi:sensor histidine kinase YesM
MAEATVFRNSLEFLGRIGIYDVVLPFLLVFAIVFAILEKTRILGTEQIEGKRYTKKNINGIVAFVIAFLVVASSKLVAIINVALAQIVLLLLVSVMFLLLIGSFYKEGEEVYLGGRWRTFMMIVMFVGVVFIFLHAIPYEDTNFLTWFWSFLANNWDASYVSAIILILFILGVFYLLLAGDRKPVGGGGSTPPKKE